MASITTHTQTTAPVFGFVRTVFSSIADGVQSIVWASDAARQVNALMDLSDAELAERGLKRRDIAQYVFSDNYWT